MKTCKSFFHKSLIITSVDELKKRNVHYYSYSYGFCLLSCSHGDYTAQSIYKFSGSYDEAEMWLSNEDRHTPGDIYGIVLGSEL